MGPGGIIIAAEVFLPDQTDLGPGKLEYFARLA